MTEAPGASLRTILGLAQQDWNRLSAAAAASLALHSAAILGLDARRAQEGAPSRTAAMVVRLASVPLAPTAPFAEPAKARRNIAPAPPPVFEAASREIAAAGVAAAAAPPYYYPRAELDQSPAPVGELVPEFPAQASVRAGRVRLRILIDERGYPDEVTVVRAEPAGVFDQAAIAAFGRARYSPGIRNGIAVRSQLLLEVEYVDSSSARPGVASNRNSY